MKRLISVSMIVFLILLSSQVMGASDEESPDLIRCRDDLNRCYLNVSHFNSRMIELEQQNKYYQDLLRNISNERDYYKDMYENIVIGNYTVGDINYILQNITNLYQYIDNRTYNLKSELKQEIKQIYVKQIIISFALTLSLLGGITFAFWKINNKFKIFAKLEETITNIESKIKIHEKKETHFHTTLNKRK